MAKLHPLISRGKHLHNQHQGVDGLERLDNNLGDFGLHDHGIITYF